MSTTITIDALQAFEAKWDSNGLELGGFLEAIEVKIRAQVISESQTRHYPGADEVEIEKITLSNCVLPDDARELLLDAANDWVEQNPDRFFEAAREDHRQAAAEAKIGRVRGGRL